MLKPDYRVPLDDLGMDEKAMLELVNRLNKHDDRKWVFCRGQPAYQQMANPFAATNPYFNQVANPLC